MPPLQNTRPGSTGASLPSARHLARLRDENPQRLAEISRKGANSAARRAAPRKVRGAPRHMTNGSWASQTQKAGALADSVIEGLAMQDALPANPIAQAAMKQAIQMLATDIPLQDRLRVVRTLLEYNLARPAASLNAKLIAPEDFLDALAAENFAQDQLL